MIDALTVAFRIRLKLSLPFCLTYGLQSYFLSVVDPLVTPAIGRPSQVATTWTLASSRTTDCQPALSHTMTSQMEPFSQSAADSFDPNDLELDRFVSSPPAATTPWDSRSPLNAIVDTPAVVEIASPLPKSALNSTITHSVPCINLTSMALPSTFAIALAIICASLIVVEILHRKNRSASRRKAEEYEECDVIECDEDANLKAGHQVPHFTPPRRAVPDIPLADNNEGDSPSVPRLVQKTRKETRDFRKRHEERRPSWISTA